MKYKLFKLSEPGWELEFDTRKEVEYKLLSCICYECKKSARRDASDCKEETMNVEGHEAVDTMLSTPCGLEFDLEEV